MRRTSLATRLALAGLLGLATLPAMAQAPAAAPATTAAPMARTPATTAAPMTRTPAAAMPTGPAVNVNTASAAQLDALPQIGAKRAASIIAHRPYKTPDELVSKKAVSQGIYNKIKARVTTS